MRNYFLSLIAVWTVLGCGPKEPGVENLISRPRVVFSAPLTSEPLKKKNKASDKEPPSPSPAAYAEGRSDAPPRPARPKFHLVPAAKEALYKSFFPVTNDSAVNALRDRVTFYDDDSMPRLYQVWDEGAQDGLVSSESVQETANNEFPWAGPAGTLPNNRIKTIRFVKLEKPIRWFHLVRQQGYDGIRWTYPIGTIFGEMLLVTDPQGFDHTAELRLRRKNEDGDWTVNAFRPFPTEKDFRHALSEYGIDFQSEAAMVRGINSAHENRPFQASARFQRLPGMPPGLVAALLDETTFKSARHKAWSAYANGPTTTRFSIVPQNFLGGLIPVNRESCARCHEDAGRVVNLEGDRRWRVRGGDRIFSFHIFAPDSRGLDLRLNPRLISAGLLQN